MTSELLTSNGTQEGVSSALGHPVIVGLIGRGIQMSRTPAMHEAEGQAQNLRLIYNLIDVDLLPDSNISFEKILQSLEIAGYSGLNVTYPFKKEAMAFLDTVSDAAKAVNAVNTIILKNGKRSGYNTDYMGFRESFSRNMRGANLDCTLMIGAGGAGGAVATALLDLGVKKLILVDTNRASAEDLMLRLQSHSNADIQIYANVDEAIKEATGIVNATPIGMTKLPGCPIQKSLLTAKQWVADIVYFPLETELLKAAKTAGCKILPGTDMAIFQAVHAFELFTGRVANSERMRTTFRNLVSN